MVYSDLPQRNETKKNLFNPLRTDFEIELRDDHNVKQKYIIRSMEIEEFPTYLANIILNHLIVAVQNERNISPLNEQAVEEIRKEIIVNEL
jgi:hypothetical protein